jgi:hypothetical protein
MIRVDNIVKEKELLNEFYCQKSVVSELASQEPYFYRMQHSS